MENIRILLVDGGDRQTLPLSKAYKKLGCYVTTLCGSKLDVGYASHYPDKKLLDRSIVGNKTKHIELIRKLMESGAYDVAITTSDDTAEGLSLMKKDIESINGCKHQPHLAVVEPALFYMAYDKNRTMEVCMDNNIPCPKTYLGIESMNDIPYEQFTYPVVVKPRQSYGAIGYHRADTKEELKKIVDKIQNEINMFVFQEYIPQTDIQYEAAMFVNEDNEIKTACVFSKNRWFPINGGSSTCNCTVYRPDIVESCTKLLQTINWRGACDIDLIQDPRDGKAKIMEINPRVSGSVKVVLESGVNIAKQIIQLATGEEVSEYNDYKIDTRMRCFHTDLLWFLKSPNRFHAKPSWFSWKNTSDQIWSISDPWPFFTFSIQAIRKYRGEMEKRK